MNNQELILPSGAPSSAFTLRDLTAIAFRHKRTAVICFAGIMLGTAFAVIANPYRASIKFMVSHERQDPVVTAKQDAPEQRPPDVTEDEINSEIEILKSGDVARQVVMAVGLDKKKSLSEYILGPATPEERTSKAVDRLEGDLKIEPVNKSRVITATYTSSDPKLASRVLHALGDAYMQEHKRVFTPPGQVEFFDREAQRYKQDLATAEDAIKKFADEQDGVAPHLERDIVLQKLSDFRAVLQQTKADLATADERIHSLRQQAGTTPERLTTSTWKQDDYQVLQGFKATLMTLQLKRTEYLMKYQPDYPLVQEVDREIAQTQASIAAEESKPIRQETTDRNPTYGWINEEMAKTVAERSGLQAKLAATQATVEHFEAQARDLQQKGLTEADLYRTMKTDEENYLLYLHKREQARMTDALDNTRIVNVSVVEQPVVPTDPYNSPLLIVVIGTLVAATLTMGVVFAQEYLDPSFRTPSEVSTSLPVPLLAAVPYRLSEFHGNGHGNGNGHGANGDTSTRSSDESISINS
ncbi:MAG: GumC family protein [Terriglobales bacterium]